MSRRTDASPVGGATQAIERVLRAECDAEADLAQARLQAQALIDGAHGDALVTVNAAMERVARWQQSHAGAMQRRLDVLRDHATATALASQRPDETAVAAAVERIAELMTTAPEGGVR